EGASTCKAQMIIRDGDRMNAVLAATGYNVSLLLRWRGPLVPRRETFFPSQLTNPINQAPQHRIALAGVLTKRFGRWFAALAQLGLQRRDDEVLLAFL